MLVNREDLSNKLSRVFPFNILNSENIKLLAEKSEVVYFKAGNLVFMEGAKASSYYIIYEGEIELLVEKNQSLRRLNTLQDGDCFGEDVFRKNGIRSTSAKVLKNSILIRIPQNLLEKLIADNFKLNQAFTIFLKTYSKLITFNFKGTLRETVYYLDNPHYLTFLKNVFYSFATQFILFLLTFIAVRNEMLSRSFLPGFGSFLIAIFLLLLLWFFLNWRNDIYLITGKRIINLSKLVVTSNSKFEIPLSAINNLEIKKGIIGRSIGYGDLAIRTYTGETILKNVPLASMVQLYLEFLIAKGKTAQRIEERRAFGKIVERSIGFEEKASDTDKIQMDEISDFPENNDSYPVAIYHTHWIILFEKLIFPSLLLISMGLIIAFSYANNLSIVNNDLGFGVIGLLLISVFLWWLYQFFDWKNDQYHISQDQIIDLYRKPFGAEDRRTASIQNIQSIRFEKKGVLGLLLNFGTIFIRVGDEEFTFDNVPDPARIQEKLFNVLEMSITRMKKSELTEQQHRLAEWIDTYNEIKTERSKRVKPNN